MDDKPDDDKSTQFRDGSAATPSMKVDGGEDDQPQPEVARIRRKVHSAGRDGRVRSKTIAPKRLTREEKVWRRLLPTTCSARRPATIVRQTGLASS